MPSYLLLHYTGIVFPLQPKSDPEEAQPLIKSLQLTADYLGMNWGGHVLAHANAAGDVLGQPAALNAAKAMFRV